MGSVTPSRFGSITWNERESRYSQAKIEIYGLWHALQAYQLYIIGVKNLHVEIDASYIKGMLNNPDIQPGVAVNQWIVGIKLFHFELVHVPGNLAQCTRRSLQVCPFPRMTLSTMRTPTTGFIGRWVLLLFL